MKTSKAQRDVVTAIIRRVMGEYGWYGRQVKVSNVRKRADGTFSVSVRLSKGWEPGRVAVGEYRAVVGSGFRGVQIKAVTPPRWQEEAAAA
jgi:hypothetical protein